MEVPDVSYVIVDTGQSACWDTAGSPGCEATGVLSGQDAQWVGAQPAFADNGDGTVTDLRTGLMWAAHHGDRMTWAEAVEGASAFALAGYDDWRLPTLKELYSLIDFDGVTGTSSEDATPYLDTDYFVFRYGDEQGDDQRHIDAQYWTSTQYVWTTMNGNTTAFGVNFADGRIKGYPSGGAVEIARFVKYVRGSASYGVNDFVESGEGTVLDRATGLTWMREDSGVAGAGDAGDGTMDWPSALAWCEGQTLAGADDWRLPNAKELQSIVDYTRSPDTTQSAAIDPLFEATPIVNEMGAADYGFYWTSTSHLDGQTPGSDAVYVVFGRAIGQMNGTTMDVHGAGAQRGDPKVGDRADYPILGQGPQGDVRRVFNLVRCVRGGASYDPDPEDGSGGGMPDGGAPSGPVSCETESDCEAPEACPPEAEKGCTCAPGPQGSLCIPRCSVDEDCPAVSGKNLVCAPQVFCVPG